MKWNSEEEVFEITKREKKKIFNLLSEDGLTYGKKFPNEESIKKDIIPHLYEESMLMFGLWLMGHPEAKNPDNLSAYKTLKKELNTMIDEVEEYSETSTSELPKHNPYLLEANS